MENKINSVIIELLKYKSPKKAENICSEKFTEEKGLSDKTLKNIRIINFTTFMGEKNPCTLHVLLCILFHFGKNVNIHIPYFDYTTGKELSLEILNLKNYILFRYV